MRRLALVVLLSVPATPALALDLTALFGPAKTRAELLLDRSREARERGQHDLSESLLDDAERAGAGRALLLHERGALAAQRGQLARAVDLLSDAASLDPRSSARVDAAAALVGLGRWPEAVEALALAFEERGANLRADQVVADPRFSQLVNFAPFSQLVAAARDQEVGPLGRLLRKIERVEASVRTAGDVLAVMWRWMGVISRLLGMLGASVLLLVCFGIFLGAGIAQLGLLRPPWPLLAGIGIASVVWHVAVRVATADASTGLSTIALALAVVLMPFAAATLWRRLRRHQAPDPLDALHLPGTLAMADELGRAGRALVGLPDDQRIAAVRELERAADTLARRLTRRP